MKKSTKILLIVFIVFSIASSVFARYILSAISFQDGNFKFDFNAYSISALVLGAVSLVFGGLLFFRFIKSLPLDRAIFFSSVPLVVVYGVSMFFLSGLASYQGDLAKSVSSALNITKDSQYNTILWAVVVSFVFVIILFMNYFILARPVSKIERVVSRLSDGKIKNERIKLGGTVQFANIEHSLNKINNNYTSRERNELHKRRKQRLSKNLWKFFGKADITELENGKTITKNATIFFLKLSSNESRHSLEETFHYANSYFHTISPIIDRYDGFIDEFFGDGILAVFPTPVKAIECALLISKAIENINRKNKNQLNLNYRSVITSEVVDFSLVEDKPKIISQDRNMLSTIEQATNNMGLRTIFTKNLLDRLPLEYRFAYRYIGTISIEQNKHFLFENIEVLHREKQRRLIKTKNLFEKGVQLYQAQAWQSALACFEKVLKYDSSDKCAYIYFNNCKDKID